VPKIIRIIINFEVIEIQEPLDMIPERPTVDASEPNNFLEEEDSDSKDMEGDNNHEEEREILL
jgi:hypothetical protein